MSRLTEALDLAEQIGRLETAQDVSARLGALARDYGFHAHVLASFQGPGTVAEPRILAAGWAQEWQERYLVNQYAVDDPVVVRATLASMPFRWSDALNEPWVTPRGVRVFDEARAFRLCDGVFIPVYGPKGLEGGLSLGGERVDVGAEELKALHLVGLYAYDHVRALSQGDPAWSAGTLTPRELECLKWVAAGKTSWEISQVLGISRHTADWYLAEAVRKLGAANRTHAVAEAFRRAMIG
ncbi:helix-turn-helix transcriptional regulator [Polymorphum gilvum]|uniref:Transcriptional regulator, LuxR family n=1 Tax=Polymorphum gilvum (strain LMG 25793 / CGMCC 1.9160 / SL003B-26A1) TaxID=991905 RepID=F2J277_POLGS|nr:LuxR family transcriptional regulator [Polymorphum gilvum]ADZ68836.1 Transcriptional regulator, LuxR family [Polymorphum gilvum SL003B-26A1]